MAEQQTSYEFVTIGANDITAERQAGWESFTRFSTWCIVATVVVLVLMAIFNV